MKKKIKIRGGSETLNDALNGIVEAIETLGKRIQKLEDDAAAIKREFVTPEQRHKRPEDLDECSTF